MFEKFTLGIEEEFQIVDPATRELKSHVSEILEEGRLMLGEKVKPEMIQSMIEVGTAVIPTWPRHPQALAAQALTTQAATGGRTVLGGVRP